MNYQLVLDDTLKKFYEQFKLFTGVDYGNDAE